MSYEALERRFLKAAEAVQVRPPATFNLEAFLFGKQLAFVNDPATFGTAVCTRRAGKSVGIAAWLLDGPLKTGAPSLYFAITRKEAKRIIWPIMRRLNREHRLGYSANESELTLSLNGEPKVYLMGVDTKDEIEKARGTGWGRVAGDEAQMLPPYIEEMVNDVLMPSFMDYDGKIRLIGTPGAVPVGYFHDLRQNEHWSHHSWTVWENPHLPNARRKLEEVLKARGVTEAHPSIQREWFGKWVYDPDSLVFAWDAERNGFDALPPLPTAWQHVIGVDLGYDDADAIAVIAFNDRSPAAYLVHEDVLPKQTITGLTEKIDALVKRYKPHSVVVDTGGLGKKIAVEVTHRTGVALKAAEKPRKFEFIEILNDSLRTGRFYAKKDSRFARDALLVEWDREKMRPDKKAISDRYHSDICDAVLYGFREALHWLHEPEKPPGPAPGTPEAFATEEEAIVSELEQAIADEKAATAMDTNGGWGWSW